MHMLSTTALFTLFIKCVTGSDPALAQFYKDLDEGNFFKARFSEYGRRHGKEAIDYVVKRKDADHINRFS